MIIDISRLFVFFVKSLSRGSIKRVILFLLVSIISAILEMLVVATTLPFLTSVLSPKEHNKYSSFFWDIQKVFPFKFYSQNDFLFFVFVTLMLSSLVLKVLVSFMQANTSAIISHDFATKAFEGLISQALKNHKNLNYAKVQAFFTRIFEISNTLLNPIIIIVQSSLVLLLTIGALLVIEPVVTSVVFLSIIVFYLFISIFINRNLRIYGQQFSSSQVEVNSVIFETYNLFKIIILDNLKLYFIKDFGKKSYDYIKSISYNVYFSSLTKPIIETFTILLILFFYFTNNGNADENDFNFAFIGTLFFAAQRIIPALQQIYSQYASILGRLESVKESFGILKKFSYDEMSEKVITENISFEDKIIFSNVSFKYDSKSDFLINNVSIEIRKGEKIGIFGPSGVGKSSFVDLLIGFYKPEKGEIIIDLRVLTANNILDWRSKISFVPQKIFISNKSVYENVAFGIPQKEIDKKRVEKCLEVVMLKQFISSFDAGCNTVLSENGLSISGGQAQRIGIARALYKNADILIMDESTSALDYETENQILNNIYNHFPNLTIINIAHRLSTLKNCDVLFSFENNSIREIRNKDQINNITNL